MNGENAWLSAPTIAGSPSQERADPPMWRSGRTSLLSTLREAWTYREVLWFLVWRDIKVRYKQTVLGATWAVLQPVLAMIVFSVFLGGLAGVSSDGTPYPLFVFCALVPWQLFAHALVESGNSLVSNQQLITKVYFPRVFLPLAPILAGLLDFGLSMLVLIGLMAWYGVAPGLSVVLLGPLSLFAIATAFAVGIWLAAINLRYRDVRYLLPFLTQLWLFASPVTYSTSVVPQAWHPWYGLNPMVGVIDGFRSALLGIDRLNPSTLFISLLVVVVLLAGGFRYFQISERQFADVA